MEEISFDQIIQVFRIHRRLFFKLFFVILCAALMVLLFTKVAYSVKASLILQEEEDSMNISPVTMLLGKQSRKILNDIEIIKSRELTDSVIEELNLSFEISQRGNRMVNYILNMLSGRPTVQGSLIIKTYPTTMTTDDSVLQAIDTGFSLKTGNVETICRFNEDCKHAGAIVNIEKLGEIASGVTYDISYRNFIKTREQLLENIQAEPLGDNKDGNIFQIFIESSDPYLAARVLSTVIAHYMNLKISWKKNDADEQQKYIIKIIGDIKLELDQKSLALATYQKENRTVLPDLQFTEIMKRNVEIEKDIAILHLKEQIITKFIASIKIEDSSPIPAPIIIDDMAVQAALQVHNGLVAQEKTFSTTLSDHHPDMIKLRENIRKAKKDLLQLLVKTNETFRNGAAILEQQSATTSDIIKNLPNNLMNIAGLQRDVEITEKLYAFLMQKYYEAGITASIDNVPVRILDTPTPIIKKSKPMLSMFFVLSVALSLIFASCLLFFFDFFRKRISSFEDVKKLFPFSSIILAHKRAISAGIDETTIPLTRSIAFTSTDRDNIIALLSFCEATMGEQLALNIAKQLRVGDRPNLLIVFSDNIAVNQNTDPLTILRKDVNTLSESLRPIETDTLVRLDVATSLSPLREMISCQQFRQLLDLFRTKYPRILLLFSTPPETGLDRHALLSFDKVVLVAETDVTRFAQLLAHRKAVTEDDSYKYHIFIAH